MQIQVPKISWILFTIFFISNDQLSIKNSNQFSYTQHHNSQTTFLILYANLVSYCFKICSTLFHIPQIFHPFSNLFKKLSQAWLQITQSQPWHDEHQKSYLFQTCHAVCAAQKCRKYHLSSNDISVIVKNLVMLRFWGFPEVFSVSTMHSDGMRW